MQNDRVNILLIEDDPVCAEQTLNILQAQKEDYEVEVSPSAEEGLHRIHQQRYHLLLLDMSLPGMNGLQALEKLNRDRIQVPVIFLIKEGERECAQRALELGALDYLTKVEGFFTALPFTVERVLQWQRLLAKPEEETSKQKWWESGNFYLQMIEDIVQLNHLLHQIPLEEVIKRVNDLACRYFRFEKSDFYLRDSQRGVFIKTKLKAGEDGNSQEVSQEVIDKILAGADSVKMVYSPEASEDTFFPGNRRSQKRRGDDVWLDGDRIFLNFTDHEGTSLACLVLEEPLDKKIPSHQSFLSMKIFAKLISLSLQQFLLLDEKERRIRRLKQILVTSNIFKLGLPLRNLFREAVWNVRFSLGFNLVLLGFLVERTGKLEVKAAACDDRQKQLALQGMSFSLRSVVPLLHPSFKVSNSYLIADKKSIFSKVKDIYRQGSFPSTGKDRWPPDAVLLTPINNREGKIIGFFIVDDPIDGKKPAPEDIRLLEKVAKQVATAIENRMLYLRVKKTIEGLENENKNLKTKLKQLSTAEDSSEGRGLGRLVFRWSGRD